MVRTRQPAVAGTFYPAQPEALRAEITAFLNAAAPAAHAPKALIAPHAGYVYSGPIAGSAYNAIGAQGDLIQRVVLLGPAHRVYVEGIAASGAQQFAIPTGDIPVDTTAVNALVDRFDFVSISDAAHQLEHSLEVQLPFLAMVLPRFSLIPLAVGNATAAQVTAVLDVLWGGPETLIVISSDLSHYHDYETARGLDRFTSRRITALDPRGLTSEHACGVVPVSGLLHAAARHGLRATALDVRNSGDTAGTRDRVVGYGAYAFYEPQPNA
ncbi:MAG: AmmeMemoRadiSam system protein B [Gammaproteobacteria bacterium]|nr:AmmeMemoRadiSam system protein B [Gammaproteobacteria bacterium]